MFDESIIQQVDLRSTLSLTHPAEIGQVWVSSWMYTIPSFRLWDRSAPVLDFGRGHWSGKGKAAEKCGAEALWPFPSALATPLKWPVREEKHLFDLLFYLTHWKEICSACESHTHEEAFSVLILVVFARPNGPIIAKSPVPLISVRWRGENIKPPDRCTNCCAFSLTQLTTRYVRLDDHLQIGVGDCIFVLFVRIFSHCALPAKHKKGNPPNSGASSSRECLRSIFCWGERKPVLKGIECVSIAATLIKT